MRDEKVGNGNVFDSAVRWVTLLPEGKSMTSRSCCIQLVGIDTRVLSFVVAVSKSLNSIEKQALGSEIPFGGGRSSLTSASG